MSTWYPANYWYVWFVYIRLLCLCSFLDILSSEPWLPSCGITTEILINLHPLVGQRTGSIVQKRSQKYIQWIFHVIKGDLLSLVHIIDVQNRIVQFRCGFCLHYFIVVLSSEPWLPSCGITGEFLINLYPLVGHRARSFVPKRLQKIWTTDILFHFIKDDFPSLVHIQGGLQKRPKICDVLLNNRIQTKRNNIFKERS